MPIRIPNNLPARKVLEKEGVNVMTEATANRQDIRPLRIGLLNLMPNKIKTETQFARLIGASPLQVEMTLITTGSHTPKNTSAEHMLAFYQPWADLKDQYFDGLIITGAPVELLPFEDVNYWTELTQIYEWAKSHVHSTFNICWAAQAAIHHFHGVPKYPLPQKAFGIYAHRNLNPASPYLRGFSDDFSMPVSRWTDVRHADLPKQGLDILLESDEIGLCLINDPKNRQLLMFNHIEYDTDSLGEEYRRDVEAKKAINKPAHYFPGDDPAKLPENRWRAHAHLLFGNWINEVYQTTPFDLKDIGKA
ncbi:homoserine O-succinyltransferase [Aestuariivirga litoralis]|uniref:homoserine O-succinyltransferase n=1 Tax=Aestuariivirga litoralis TaxID=2650924 RepID=UPI0018C84961|nr:homoserine O-succinyltransferase [Aestuariivirga litoralis]MBG1233016.1 homoserine O-succinyltransferase [Aestuariivirga litoralis]